MGYFVFMLYPPNFNTKVPQSLKHVGRIKIEGYVLAVNHNAQNNVHQKFFYLKHGTFLYFKFFLKFNVIYSNKPPHILKTVCYDLEVRKRARDMKKIAYQSKQYKRQYRFLKEWYEKELGRKVVDKTFSNFLRNYRKLIKLESRKSSIYSVLTDDIMSGDITKDLKVYLDYKLKLGRPCTNLTAQRLSLKVFDKFEESENMTFEHFVKKLSEFLDFDFSQIHRGNFNNWFSAVNQPYPFNEPEKILSKEDLNLLLTVRLSGSTASNTQVILN